jgi:Na+-transporting methylmalonyl-CoA/oxaloacetate decarboxylase gamma subunit
VPGVMQLTVIGLLIVFVVLALISIVVNLIRRLDYRWQMEEAKRLAEQTEKVQTIDNTTLILITAAVSTIVGGRFLVRKVRVLPRGAARTPWSSQGRAVLLGSDAINRPRK